MSGLGFGVWRECGVSRSLKPKAWSNQAPEPSDGVAFQAFKMSYHSL